MAESYSSGSEKKAIAAREEQGFFSGFVSRDNSKRLIVLLALFVPLLGLWIYFKFAFSTLIFIFYFLTFLIFRLDGRIAVATGLIFLLSLPFLLISGKEGMAEQAAIYAYFFLVIGVVLEVVEMFRRRPKKIEEVASSSGKELDEAQEKPAEELEDSEIREQQERQDVPETTGIVPEEPKGLFEKEEQEEEIHLGGLETAKNKEEMAAYEGGSGGFHRQMRPGPRLERLRRRRVRLRRAKRRRMLAIAVITFALLFSVVYLVGNWRGGGEKKVVQRKPTKSSAKEKPERLAAKPTKKSSDETKTSPIIDKSKVKVEVQNGNGVSKEAARIATLLKKVGYGDIQTADAERNDYPQTIIRYSSGKKNVAEAVAKDLSSEYPSQLKEELSPQSSVDVVVILGLDSKKPIVDKNQIKVKVLNGNGINKEAGRIRDVLGQLGYSQVSVGEASNYNYPQTIIQHKPGKASGAKAVAQDLSSHYPSKLEQSLEADSPQDIVVILGKDRKG